MNENVLKEILEYINYRLDQIKMIRKNPINDEHLVRCSFAINELEDVKKFIKNKMKNENQT